MNKPTDQVLFERSFLTSQIAYLTPNSGYAIGVELDIGRQNGHFFADCLSDKQAVEWVSMMERKRCQRQAVLG